MKITPIKTGSDGNFYILETRKARFIIECGLDKTATIKCLFNIGLTISDFKGCFISHKHSDHCQSAKWVNKFMPIYSNREVMSAGYKGKPLDFNKKYVFEDLTVLPFELKHGNVLNSGYIFKDDESKVLFMTDFFSFDNDISKIAFTDIFIECNWTKHNLEEALARNDEEYSKYERQINTHCSLEVLVNILKDLNLTLCDNITLIHPSKYMCDRELALFTLRNAFPNKNIAFAKNLI